MLSGFSGHLFSEYFLERHLAEHPHTLGPDAKRELFAWRKGCTGMGPASAVRTLVDLGAAPMVRVLGFNRPEQVEHHEDCAIATITCVSSPVALVVVRWGERLDPFWRFAITESRKRLASWCVLFNGTHARLVETRRVYSRRYVEFDLDLTLEDDRTLAVLWILLHARALTESPAGDNHSHVHGLLDASERHAAGVSRLLKDGVLTASGSVLGALLKRRPMPRLDDTFEQALTIVYRMLFLLFAEARGLAPLWHPVYRESYSVAAMRDAAERERSSAGLWDALRAISHLAHAGCRAGSLRVTAFNGRLFAPSRTPLAERRDLDDEAARAAVLALSTRPGLDRAGRERIAYRDLGVEQLGAVYETLLDYEPRTVMKPRAEPRELPAERGRKNQKRVVALQPGSNLRKSTGTFYTPQPIAAYLIRRTLAQLVAESTPEQILNLKVLDPAMGSGAFLVAACGYLAQAYESALVRVGACHPADLGPPERLGIRRTVAERCLYGVDLNPMAVQLARLSLWLATLAADKPLSFLDHHLQAGDSLLGAWLSSLRNTPADARAKARAYRSRRRQRDEESLPLFEETAFGDALAEALPVRFTLASLPDDTAERVREKERALAALNGRHTALSKWKRIADLWCAHWFSDNREPGASPFRALSDAILTGRCALPENTVSLCLEEAERIAAARHFFHWELEFPEVFFDADGTRRPAPGFDAIIGNPPWDMIRADTGSADSRSRTRREIGGTMRFTRDSGAYGCQSAGHVNRYQLFVERVVSLARPHGRFGLVLPSGLAMDHGSAALRRLLFSQCAVDSIVGFENRLRVFPIHRSVRFLLVTATRGSPTTEIGCRLGEVDPTMLETAEDNNAQRDPWFTVRMSPALLKRLSGDDLSVPDVRAPIDLAIAERAAALFPALGDECGWGIRFGRELNATEDREQFRPAGRGLPIVEGKAIEPFRVHLHEARCSITAGDATRMLGARHERPRLAYRDVASATNRLTLIAAILPAACVSTHTVFCLRTMLPARAQQFLCGLFNSLVLNYLVRLRVATHVTTAIVERLPVPKREAAPGAFEEVAAIARFLARRPPGRPDAAAKLFARLNACVGRLYRLTDEEFEHVLGTFPLVEREVRAAALREFKQ